MREIKFRGKSVESWAYGFYCPVQDDFGGAVSSIYDIIRDRFIPIELHTLGQYTGLKDKNGVEIYEGEILIDRHTEELCQIEFEEGKFVASFSTYVTDLSEVYQDLEVIGNIYENKELLEG